MKFIELLFERIKKNYQGLGIIAIAFIAVICLVLNSYGPTLGVESFGNESYVRSVYELDKETTIKAIVPVEEDSEALSLLFATYARSNSGQVSIKIRGTVTNTLYVERIVNVSDIVDNAYLTSKFSEKLREADKQVEIELSSNSESGKAIGIYYTTNSYFDNSSFTINDEVMDGYDLSVRTLTTDSSYQNFANALIAFTIISFGVLMVFALLLEPRKEVLFAISAFVLGLIFMIIIVPMSPPDEQTHYEIALQISNKMMGVKDNLIDSIYLKYGSMYGHYNISAGYGRLMREFLQPLKLTGQMIKPSGDLEGRYLIPYLPIALGISIGRMVGMNMITMFYFARFFNLLFYVLCVYLSVKTIPAYKSLIGILMIMPMMLQTSIAITYDAFVIGLSYLSFAYFLKWFFAGDVIEIKEIIMVFLICAGLAPAKVVYCFLAFAFIFVPTKAFGSRKRKIITNVILCIPAIIALYGIMAAPLSFMFKKLFASSNTLSLTLQETKDLIIANVNQYDLNGVGIREGVTFNTILTNPGAVLEIFIRTVRYRIKTWFYGSLGRSLSGDTLIIPLKMVHIMVGIVIAQLLVKQDLSVPWWIRTLSVIMCIVIGLYILVGFFLSWTGVDELLFDSNNAAIFGGQVVEGIQGRYFSPILPYFFILFQHKKFGLSEKSEKYIYCAYLILLFSIIIYILSYTFVN